MFVVMLTLKLHGAFFTATVPPVNISVSSVCKPVMEDASSVVFNPSIHSALASSVAKLAGLF